MAHFAIAISTRLVSTTEDLSPSMVTDINSGRLLPLNLYQSRHVET